MADNFYVCRKRSSFSLDYFIDLWHYRNLLGVFVKRDLKIRYRYTMLGGLWSIIQPLSMMVIFSLVFSRIFHVKTAGVPYPLFSYSALIIWQSVSKMLIQGGTSLSEYSYMLSKIYFPRILVPLAVIIGGWVDFLISSVILLGMVLFYGVSFTTNLLWLPLILLMCLNLTTGLTLWISALDVQFRDIRAALPFLLQVWMFATPIMYPTTIIPAHLHCYYYLNPLVTQIELFRWALLGGTLPASEYIIIAGIFSLIILLSGLFFFNKIQGTLVDRV
jgi:lipopolysaccharide transport system permease protein